MTFEEWWESRRRDWYPRHCRGASKDAYDAGVAHTMARYEAAVINEQNKALVAYRERLAAAEKVIEAARLPARLTMLDCGEEYPRLRKALKEYDEVDEIKKEAEKA